MFLHNVFEYAEEDDDVQATRDFATLMDHGYINKYISSKSNYISVHLLLSCKLMYCYKSITLWYSVFNMKYWSILLQFWFCFCFKSIYLCISISFKVLTLSTHKNAFSSLKKFINLTHFFLLSEIARTISATISTLPSTSTSFLWNHSRKWL